MMHSHPAVNRPISRFATRAGLSHFGHGKRLIVGVNRGPDAAAVLENLEARGWQVHLALSSEEVSRLVAEFPEALVLLPEEGIGLESGWLISRKLLVSLPHSNVMIFSKTGGEQGERISRFIGVRKYLAGVNPTEIARALVASR